MYYVNNPVPETDRPITLWRGIDTIKIGIGVQWSNRSGLATLAELQGRIRKTPSDYLYELGDKQWADVGSIPIVSSRLVHLDYRRFPVWAAAFLHLGTVWPRLQQAPRDPL